MLDYLGDKAGNRQATDAATVIEKAVEKGFAENRLRPMEFGGDMGTIAVTREVIEQVKAVAA